MKLFPFLFLICFLSYGQEPLSEKVARDSISHYLNEARGEDRIPFLKRAMLLSRKIEDDTLIFSSSVDYGLASYFVQDTIALDLAQQNLDFLFSKNKDSFALAKSYHFRALKYKIGFKLDSSYKNYNESKNISIKLKDSLEVGRRLLSMGLMQKNERDLIGAEETLTDCLKYLEPMNDYFGFIGSTYNNLGLVLIELNNSSGARKYFDKSFENYEKENDSITKRRGFIDYYNNTGYSYVREKKYEEAIPFLEKGLSFENVKEDFKFRYESLYGNLADCYYLIGETQKAWKMFFELLSVREANKNIYGQSISHDGNRILLFTRRK